MEFKIGFHHGQRGSLNYSHPVFIHPSVYMDNSDDITISSGVSLARNVRIYTHDHDHRKGSDQIRKSPLFIGKNVFINDGAIVLESVRYIGDNAVIGAGSVLTKNVQPSEIRAGNPARKIGER